MRDTPSRSLRFEMVTKLGSVVASLVVVASIVAPTATAQDENAYVIFREHVSGLEYIRRCSTLHAEGLYVELGAFSCQVFLDFHIVHEDPTGLHATLAAEAGLVARVQEYDPASAGSGPSRRGIRLPLFFVEARIRRSRLSNPGSRFMVLDPPREY